MVRRVEWIGVTSPREDMRVTMREIHGLYTDLEEVTLEAVAQLVAPLIRQQGHTMRGRGVAEGLSKDYWWGPKHFICEMEDIDADRLFTHPDEYEWRDLDNPDHDDRVPVVPWPWVTQVLWRIMQEAQNGPGVYLKGTKTARNDRQVERLVDQWVVDRIDQAKDRGLKLDENLRLVRPR